MNINVAVFVGKVYEVKMVLSVVEGENDLYIVTMNPTNEDIEGANSQLVQYEDAKKQFCAMVEKADERIGLNASFPFAWCRTYHEF